MNLSNQDENNSMLIDKPLLKPIDLLVDRPIDANVNRANSRLTQPIVERFVEQSFGEAEEAYEETYYNNSNVSEPVVKAKPNIVQKAKDKPASKVLANREHELEGGLPEARRPIVRKRTDNIDELPIITHLLDELDNPDVIAKIKLIINDNTSFDEKDVQLSATINRELELQNRNLGEQVRSLSDQLNLLTEQNRTLMEQSRTIAEQNRSLNEQNRALNEQGRPLNEQNNSLNEKNRSLVEENQALTEQLAKSLKEVKTLKKIAISLKEEKNEYANKTGTLADEHKKIASKVQKFEYDQKMFRLFTLLAPEVKSSLRGIFKVDTYENFIACGSQRSNIDSLWDFAKNRVQKQQFDEIETLNQILLYFIDIFNQTSNTPTIKIQEVAIGTNFDTETHIKSSNSVKPAGIISNIYLLGYQNHSNDKILNKAIVLIGG